MIAIKQGCIAEAAISGVIEMINSMINHKLFLISKWSPQEEMGEESAILTTS